MSARRHPQQPRVRTRKLLTPPDVPQLQDSVQRLEEKLSNLESENQVFRQQALTMSPTGKSISARPRMTIVQQTRRSLNLRKSKMSQGLRGSPQSAGLAFLNGRMIGRLDDLWKVEENYPALLFKQQLTAFLEKIYGMIRENLKKEISPLLGLCIQVDLLKNKFGFDDAFNYKEKPDLNAALKRNIVAHVHSQYQRTQLLQICEIACSMDITLPSRNQRGNVAYFVIWILWSTDES